MTKTTDPIPTRLRLSALVAQQTAQLLFHRLVSGWGLVNACKIVETLTTMLRTEKKRRKKLEETK